MISVIPYSGNSIIVKGLEETNNTMVLPKLGIRTFNHSFEITVTDLTGYMSHVIVVRQNGDVEVDK